MKLSRPLCPLYPAFLAVAFAMSACDEPSEPRQRQQADSPHKVDPVSELQKISEEVNSSRAVQTSAEEWREWKKTTYAKYGEELIQSEAAKKRYFKVKGVDVQKTDSLVTPLVGYIVLERTIENPDQKRYYDGLFRVTFAWQDEEWYPKNIESKDSGTGDDDWRGQYKGYPAANVLRDVFPERLTWQLID